MHCGIGSFGLLARPVSENGGLCQGAGGHDGGERRRSVLMLTTLHTLTSQSVMSRVASVTALAESRALRAASGQW
jgi:hypothetical protein